MSAAAEAVSSHGWDDRRPFELWAQPIVDLTCPEGDAVGHELLLRQADPNGTMVCPAGTIADLEANGGIVELDVAVARRACQMAGRLPATVQVNVSARTVVEAGHIWVAALCAEAFRHQVPTSRFVAEITETWPSDDLLAVASFAEMARQVGVKVSLDDFGAGGSGLARLIVASADQVKLDGAMLSHATSQKRWRNTLAELISVLAGSGVDIVAEAVPDDKVRRWLVRCGVRYGQSFCYGRPSVVV